MALTEITDTDPIRRITNKTMMVRFINADLMTRSHLDIRTSIVFYDADKLFDWALSPEAFTDDIRAAMDADTSDRFAFYSTGIV